MTNERNLNETANAANTEIKTDFKLQMDEKQQ